jgi:hypothetical protein
MLNKFWNDFLQINELPKKVEEIQNVLACVEDHSLDK